MSKNDKSKSGGGLLDIWFGRPKTKGRGGTTNGGRPISSESDTIGDMQELHNEIMKLTVDEIDQKFTEILEDMNIPKDKRQPLLKKSLDEKRDMILMHFKGKSSLEHRSSSRFEKPQDFIGYLREEHSAMKIHACLESLRVALTSNPLSWMKEFGEDGINQIIIMLQICKHNSDKKQFDKIEYECIRCLKAIVNNTWGLNLILTPDLHAAVLLLAKCLDPKKPQTMCEAVRLLAGFCLIAERNGYEKVLRAMSMAHDGALKNGERFKPIVDGLFAEDEQADPKRELCCHSLIFINTLTNTPTELNFRLHLRCEIMRMGLFERLEQLTNIVNTSTNDNLTKHFKIFNEIREDDFEEFSQRFDNVRLEMDDINDCYELLKNIVAETPSEPYLLSILQHLLYIRDDHLFRPAYFQLIEECVSQIVLHKAGCDPNFESRDFKIDTAVLLDELVEKSKANENIKIEEYDRKFEALETARQEAEARAHYLEERIKEFEATGVMPQKVSKLPTVNIPPPPPMMPGMRIPAPPPPPGSGGGGGPPPPPPPPMPGAMGPPRPPPMPGSGGPPPPPMPGMPGMPPPPPMFRMPGALPLPNLNTLPSYLKPKKKYDPEGPMKRANWKAIIPQKMSEKAFWVKCQEEKLASEDIFAGLAAKFSSKPMKKSDKDAVDKPIATKKNVVELRVLDGKAAQNILILLGGSLKHLSHEQIKQSILRCDTTVLTSNIIQQLIQYLPPPDQLKRLQEIKATGDELSAAEKFAATLGEVKRLVPRLHSLNFKMNFADMVQDVKPDIVAGNAACSEVKTSKKFAKILELILLFGNYMNSGSKNGQAFGFEISFLTKLTNTKDLENKHTLLHYMVETIENKFPELLNFAEELPHVDRAARVSLENIQKTMHQMTTSVKNLKSDLENNKVPQSDDDQFLNVMGEFLKECREQVDVLVGMKNNMETYYKEVGEYFSFDTNKYPMEEFFSDIKTFKELFMQSHREVVKIRDEEEKARRIRDAREQAQRHLQDRQQRKLALVDMDAAQTQEGVMDSLLEALQTGSAFGNRDQRRKRGQRPAGAERRAQLSRSRSRTRVIPSTAFVTAS